MQNISANYSQILSDTQHTKIQGCNITLTTTHFHKAIEQIKNNNSEGPDKLNIRHLKHIYHLGFAFLTIIFETALNNNIISHIWKLANKDIDKGTSYRPLFVISVIAKTLEKSIISYKTANIPTQLGYTIHHYTVTALQTSNNIVTKGSNKIAPPARSVAVLLDIRKAFDTINVYILIRKMLHTNIPGTTMTFIGNYIKGRKPYTAYIHYTSIQR